MIQQIQSVLAFGMPGGWEWLIILVVAVLIFGRRLPEIARGMGKSLTEFKKGVKEAQNQVEDVANTDEDVISPSDTEESVSKDQQ